MEDIEKVMGWLEGLTFDDWRDCYSDSEVSNTAKATLELLKEQANAYNYLQKQFFEVQDKLIAKPEVIRCKDCKWHSEKGFCKHPNGGAGNIRPANWFCADGERKEVK